MAQATFQFHGELNDFLPRGKKQRRFVHHFDHLASVKDMIESLGIPHPEVDVIVVNAESRDFNYLVQGDDDIHVYPPGSPLTDPNQMSLQPPPLVEPRFILDVHLGKLASYLRMLGFDTLYRNDYADDTLAEVSYAEKRILLSRDLGVLKRGIVAYGYFPRQTNAAKQLVELFQRYDLVPYIKPFTRCIECNSPLDRVDKGSVWHEISPKTRHYYDEFYRCTRNGKIYWKGSHYERMRGFIRGILGIDLP